MHVCIWLLIPVLQQNKPADNKHPVVNTKMILHCKQIFIDFICQEEC